MSSLRFILPVLLTLAGCSDGNNNHNKQQDFRPPLELTASEAPIALPGISAFYTADVPYGERELNRFDIYLPDCDEPTPLVIFIHSGGFTGGDKDRTHANNADEIREFLQACVASIRKTNGI